MIRWNILNERKSSVDGKDIDAYRPIVKNASSIQAHDFREKSSNKGDE